MKFVLVLALAVGTALVGWRGAAGAATLPELPATYIGPTGARPAGHRRLIVFPDGTFLEVAPTYALTGTWIFDADGGILALTGGGKTAYFGVTTSGALATLDARTKRPVRSRAAFVLEVPDLHRTLASVTWSLVEMNGKPVIVPSGAPSPTLEFDAQASRVSGSTGCNRLMGGYTHDGNALHFTPLATTRMLCPDPHVNEQAFLAALASVTRYRIAGDTLTLEDGERAVLLFAAGT
jgi:heat shock protein HslJ